MLLLRVVVFGNFPCTSCACIEVAGILFAMRRRDFDIACGRGAVPIFVFVTLRICEELWSGLRPARITVSTHQQECLQRHNHLPLRSRKPMAHVVARDGLHLEGRKARCGITHHSLRHGTTSTRPRGHGTPALSRPRFRGTAHLRFPRSIPLPCDVCWWICPSQAGASPIPRFSSDVISKTIEGLAIAGSP